MTEYIGWEYTNIFLPKTLGLVYTASQISPGRDYFIQNNILIYTWLTWLLHFANTLGFPENMFHTGYIYIFVSF